MINLKWEFENQILDLTANPFFKITSIDGLDQPTSEFAVTTNPYKFGSKVQRVAIQPRTITINLILNYKPEVIRKELFKLFQAGEKGTLYLKNSSKEGKIQCYFQEMVTSRGDLPVKAQIFLYAENPYFEGLEEIVQEMENTYKKFKFTLAFPVGGMSLGEIKPITEVIAVNDGDVVTGVGIEIVMSGDVTDPVVHNLTRNESFRVKGSFITGDKIYISTYTGNKFVRLNNTTNLIASVDSISKWIQLNRRENSISYNAATGIENMKVNLYYKLEFGAI